MSVITRFKCQNCKYRFQRSYKWEISRAECPKCHQEVRLEIAAEPEEEPTNKILRRRPLTEWEKKKLAWYKNEKAWHDDIRGRRVLPDGNIGVFDARGNLKEVRSQRRGIQQ